MPWRRNRFWLLLLPTPDFQVYPGSCFSSSIHRSLISRWRSPDSEEKRSSHFRNTCMSRSGPSSFMSSLRSDIAVRSFFDPSRLFRSLRTTVRRRIEILRSCTRFLLICFEVKRYCFWKSLQRSASLSSMSFR